MSIAASIDHVYVWYGTPGSPTGLSGQIIAGEGVMKPGGQTGLTVIALDETGEPLNGAMVSIRVDQGVFLSTNSQIVTGSTQSNGHFTTIWQATSVSNGQVDSRQLFFIEVTKSPYKTGHTTADVLIKEQPLY